jgi:hypothetical protein
MLYRRTVSLRSLYVSPANISPTSLLHTIGELRAPVGEFLKRRAYLGPA